MAEYIERQAAIDLFYPVDPENDGSDGCTVVYKTENYTSDEIEAVISGLPAADVASVRHGKWIVTKEFNDVLGIYIEKYTCSACEEYRLTASGLSQATNYCPNCGAKMDADE